MSARLIVLGAALAFAGCSEAEPDTGLTTAVEAPAPAKSKLHAAHTDYIKPGAPVRIESDPVTLVPGQSGTVEVRITADIASPIDVSWRFPRTLQTGTSTDSNSPASTTREFLPVSAQQSLRLNMPANTTKTFSLDIPAAAAGRHYVPVTATIDGQTRTINVPVQVGKGGPLMRPAPGEVQMTPDGERVISMRAAETINGKPVE